MTSSDDLSARIDHYCRNNLERDFESLLAPIPGGNPAGEALRDSATYRAIEDARRADDASLPQGAWEYELKRADWARVSVLTSQALATQSKDLQLAAWLLEAEINRGGFAGIAAGLALLEGLCRRFWDTLYPPMPRGDLDHRVNVLRWVNEKLLPAIRRIPITATGRERDYSWADWEQAHRNEQVRSAGARNAAPPEGPALAELNSAIAATPSDGYGWLYCTLGDARAALEALTVAADTLFGSEAPSLGLLDGMLEQIQALVGAELHKRGIHADALRLTEPQQAQGSPAQVEEDDFYPPVGGPSGPIAGRADAYARLAEAADYLLHVEPHSPVPYMVRRAIEWGNLNAVELYQEVFLRFGGQISIFELLGLQPGKEQG
ncbi:type VI secretion system protein TssA [Chitiniphilus purpureus]|uniref:Type VI secretion system protein TssA n=1 Tax=Chitiniphilus purpureus TaxID=2981137 RepID=A0ABY6DSA5_9NEIS|nr:type VI secretion system protein TssA [Chitiniphilus sp. CD1]UXY17254.1 type VI secretion system protein TssA [Chitiniphilus sp. CD1]